MLYANGVYNRMPRRRLHTVIETPEFRRRVRGLLSHERGCDPDRPRGGEPYGRGLMVEAGGARKLRWATGGRGKKGGVRVVTFHVGPTVPVFVLTVFAKGEKANLSKADRNELRAVLGQLVASYLKE